MTQTSDFGRPGGTVDTPVGAQWPQGGAAPGSTDFGSATVVSDIASRSETMTAQPVEDAHMQMRVESDRQFATGGFHAEAPTRSRPSAAAVIGSAVVGAAAATAIPFMLAGRKKEEQTSFGYQPAQPQAGERRTFGRTAPWNRSWR